MADQEEVLNYKFGVNPQDAIKATIQFQKEMSKRLKLIEKSEEKIDKGIKKYFTRIGSAKRVFGPVLQKQIAMYDATVKAINTSRKAVDGLSAEVKAYDKTLKDLEARQSMASAEAKKGISEQIAEVEKLKKAKESALDVAVQEKESQLEALRQIDKTAAEAKKQLKERVFDPKDFLGAVKDSGEYFSGPLRAVIHKDIPGAFEAGSEMAGRTIEGVFKTLPKLLGKKVAGGAKAAEAGKGLKEISGLAGKFGGLLNTLSKIGPIVASVGSLVLGLVKLFVDAEAAAKDFHKEILATSGSSSFLAGNLRDVGSGAKQLEVRLGKMYDAATSFDNIRWGISKETHAAVVGALGAEGVALKKLGDRFDQVSEGALRTKGYVKDFGTMTQMSVAYSRAFGVSLSEISQFQGEMMSELGMDLDSVQSQFQYMLKGADEAGFATNKFFGIIRGFSADLTLFTLRMEDVTKVMMALGKSMSPREAQKFLQMVTQQFKGMDLLGRTRATMLAGKGGTRDTLQKDLGRRVDALGQDIENSLGEAGVGGKLAQLVKSSDPKKEEKITKFMAAHQDKLTNEQKSAIWEAARMQSKLATGDTLDIASALKDASPMAIVDILEAQSQKLFKKPLEQLTGVQRVAAAQALNMGDEQVDQLFKMKKGIIQVQEDMAQKLETNGTLTQAELDALQKLGLDSSKKAEAAAALRAKSADEVFNAMSMDQQKELQNGKKEIDFQARTAGFQTSLIDKIGALSEFLMNKFYNVVMGIWNSIVDIWNGLPKMFGGQSDAAKQAKAELHKMKAEEAARKKAATAGAAPAPTAANNLGIILDDTKPATKADFSKGSAMPKAGVAKAAPPPSTATNPVVESQDDTTNAVTTVNKTLKKGAALTPATIDKVGSTTLDAIRTGLFEYYMYSGLDRATVAAGMGTGMVSPTGFGQGILAGTAATGSTQAALAGMIAPNAEGGMVSSVSGRMADITRFPPAPPGEGWASVAPGEKILPAGGGGGGKGVKVELELKGDLRRFIQARVVEGAADFERNKRLR